MLKGLVVCGPLVHNSYSYFEEKKQAALQCPCSLQTWVYQMSKASQDRGMITVQKPMPLQHKVIRDFSGVQTVEKSQD